MGSSPSKDGEYLPESEVHANKRRNRSSVHENNNPNAKKTISGEDEISYGFKSTPRNRGVGAEVSRRVDSMTQDHDNIHEEPNIHLPDKYNRSELQLDNRAPNEIFRDRIERQESEIQQEEDEENTQQKVAALRSERIRILTAQLALKAKGTAEKYRNSELLPHVLHEAHEKLNTVIKWADNRTLTLHQDDGLESELGHAKYERKRQMKRLAQFTALRAMHESPVLTRIGEPKDAEHLAERLSAIFDIQWIAVYEKTKQYYQTRHGRTLTETELTQCLRDILQYCYTQCQEIAEHQRNTLSQTLLLSKQASLPEYSPALELRIKEYQANLAPYYLHRVLQAVKTSISEQRVLGLVIYDRELCFMAPLENYLDMCTEVCWLGQVRDPPMHLDFRPDLDTDLYRPFSNPAPRVDYLVWPLVKLYENGPLLCKGVAQFSDIYDYDPHKQFYHYDERIVKSDFVRRTSEISLFKA